MLEVIRAAEEVTGRAIPSIMEERRAGDPPILVGDAKRAQNLLGWKPQYGDIRVILEHAWKWYCNKKF